MHGGIPEPLPREHCPISEPQLDKKECGMPGDSINYAISYFQEGVYA